jgi:uncharacterized protein
MMRNAAAFGTGAIFAAGLAISGMIKPSKIVGFLDIGGAWDASLAFVMLGAIAVHFIAYRVVMRRSAPLFDIKFHVPTRKDIDLRLVLGAALFGVGWALGGFCPGPGLVAVGGGSLNAVVFIVGMTIGMLVEQVTARAFNRPKV